MFGTEFALAIAAFALLGSSINDWRKKKIHNNVRHQHSKMQKAVDTIVEGEYEGGEFQHQWSRPNEDAISPAFSPFALGGQVVVLRTTVCDNCHLVHRYIVRGFEAAQKRKLDVEGFFISGVKVLDRGCSGPKKKAN